MRYAIKSDSWEMTVMIFLIYNWLVFNYFEHSIEANDEVNAVGRKANPNKADQR